MVHCTRRQEDGRRAKPGCIGAGRTWRTERRSGEHADERAIAQGRAGRNNRAVADEGAPADGRGGDRDPAPFNFGGSQRNIIGDETLITDIQQVRRGGGGGGDLGVFTELRTEQPKPRGQIKRGVERAHDVQAQSHQLIEEPFAGMEGTEQFVGSRLHTAKQNPFECDDLKA